MVLERLTLNFSGPFDNFTDRDAEGYCWLGGESGSRSELEVAFEEGNKYGAQICLFDRPVGMTLSRFWSSLKRALKNSCLYSRWYWSLLLPAYCQVRT